MNTWDFGGSRESWHAQRALALYAYTFGEIGGTDDATKNLPPAIIVSEPGRFEVKSEGAGRGGTNLRESIGRFMLMALRHAIQERRQPNEAEVAFGFRETLAALAPFVAMVFAETAGQELAAQLGAVRPDSHRMLDSMSWEGQMLQAHGILVSLMRPENRRLAEIRWSLR